VQLKNKKIKLDDTKRDKTDWHKNSWLVKIIGYGRNIYLILPK